MLKFVALAAALAMGVDSQTTAPTTTPTLTPTTTTPTQAPTTIPTAVPSVAPSISPTTAPTLTPTMTPTTTPTQAPTSPTAVPSVAPTASPTTSPTSPTTQPTSQPSFLPTNFPTAVPSSAPTQSTLGAMTALFSDLQDTISNPDEKTQNLITGSVLFFPASVGFSYVESYLTSSSPHSDILFAVRDNCAASTDALIRPNYAGFLENETFTVSSTQVGPILPDPVELSLRGSLGIDLKKLVIEDVGGNILACTTITEQGNHTRLRLMFYLKLPASARLTEIAAAVNRTTLLENLDLLFILTPTDPVTDPERARLVEEYPDLEVFETRCLDCPTTVDLYPITMPTKDKVTPEQRLVLEYNVYNSNVYETLRILLQEESVTGFNADDFSFEPTKFEADLMNLDAHFANLVSAERYSEPLYNDGETVKVVSYKMLLGKVPIPRDSELDVGMSILAIFLLAFFGCCVGACVKFMYIAVEGKGKDDDGSDKQTAASV